MGRVYRYAVGVEGLSGSVWGGRSIGERKDQEREKKGALSHGSGTYRGPSGRKSYKCSNEKRGKVSMDDQGERPLYPLGFFQGEEPNWAEDCRGGLERIKGGRRPRGL